LYYFQTELCTTDFSTAGDSVIGADTEAAQTAEVIKEITTTQTTTTKIFKITKLHTVPSINKPSTQEGDTRETTTKNFKKNVLKLTRITIFSNKKNYLNSPA